MCKKTASHIVLLIFVVSIGFYFTACDSTAPISVDSTSNRSDSASISEKPQKMITEPIFVTDRQGLIMTGLANNESGAYEISLADSDTGRIIYYDFDTMQKIYLSSQPSAPMDNDNTAFIDNTVGGIMPVLADNSFFVFKCGNYTSTLAPDGGEKAIPYIMKMDLNGANREKMTFSSTTWFTLSSGIAYSDGLLYLMYIDYNIDRQNDSTLNLGVLDFDSQSLTSILSFPASASVDIVDVYPEGVVLRKTSGNNTQNELIYFSLITNLPETKYTWSTTTSPFPPLTNGTVIYYLDNQRILMEKDLLTGETITLSQDIIPSEVDCDSAVLYNYIYDNHLIGAAYHSTNNNTSYISISLLTGESQVINLTYNDEGVESLVSIFGETQDYFIVQNGTKKILIDDYDPAGNPITSERYLLIFSLILKDDYWNNKPNYLAFNDTIWS